MTASVVFKTKTKRLRHNFEGPNLVEIESYIKEHIKLFKLACPDFEEASVEISNGEKYKIT